MPSLLNLCFETHLSPSLAAFQQRLGLSQGELKRLVLFKPQLIYYGAEERSPTLTLLANGTASTLAAAVPATAAISAAAAAAMAADSVGRFADVAPRLGLLQHRLSLTEAELRKLVLRLPVVLGLSYEQKVEPSLNSLQTRLMLSDAELKKVVLLLPSALVYSWEAKLEPSLAAIQQRLQLSDEELKRKRDQSVVAVKSAIEKKQKEEELLVQPLRRFGCKLIVVLFHHKREGCVRRPRVAPCR